MSFKKTLHAAWHDRDSMLCVGLDPDLARFPAHLAGRTDAMFEFCRAIVDATADLACAFKPQIAYFSAARAEDQLEALIRHIHERHPGIPVVLDAKRGDIGSTAERYALEAFERYGADAVTVSPYMGFDSIQPYLDHPGRGVIMLCRTSNAGGSDLQALTVTASDQSGAAAVADEKLYERVARLAASHWNANGELGLVVGATYPAELARVRELAGPLPLLVPGIGTQGGDIEATVDAGLDADGYGMMISSSRAILYAGRGEDFADRARDVATSTRDAIRAARARRLSLR